MPYYRVSFIVEVAIETETREEAMKKAYMPCNSDYTTQFPEYAREITKLEYQQSELKIK